MAALEHRLLGWRQTAGATMNDALPDQGRPAADILRQLHDYGAHDPDYKGARLWSLVYWLDDEYADFLGRAYQAYSSANGLNPSAFKSLKRFENELIAATARLLHGAACWR
jgi:sphinganine-1-phosphate aldolase